MLLSESIKTSYSFSNLKSLETNNKVETHYPKNPNKFKKIMSPIEALTQFTHLFEHPCGFIFYSFIIFSFVFFKYAFFTPFALILLHNPTAFK